MNVALLEQLCKERGEKITNVIKKLNLAKGCMSKWRNGAIPNGETLIKLSQYFGVSTDYLLGLSEQKENEVKNNKENGNVEEKLKLSEKDYELLVFINENATTEIRKTKLPTKKSKTNMKTVKSYGMGVSEKMLLEKFHADDALKIRLVELQRNNYIVRIPEFDNDENEVYYQLGKNGTLALSNLDDKTHNKTEPTLTDIINLINNRFDKVDKRVSILEEKISKTEPAPENPSDEDIAN